MNRAAQIALWMATALWASTALGAGEPSSEQRQEAGAEGDERDLAARQILVTFEQRSTRPLPGAGSTPRGYGGGRGAYETAPRAARLARKLAREYGLRRVDEWPIRLLDVHCVVYEVPAERSAPDVLERLAADPRVETAQPMQLFEVLGHPGYDDPHYPLQHGLRAMQVEEAHRWSRGQGVRVAVVDTGVDVDHPELEGRVAVAENFVDGDALGFTRDLHGTAVAGVIASRAGNGIGIVGVAPEVSILALKACWERARGSAAAVCSSFTLAKAIGFAVDKRADVLNLSLTGPPDPLLGALLERAIDRGLIVVSARGETPGFPASLDRVIAVGAAGGGAGDSGGRLTATGGLSAPGLDVLTIRPHALYDFMTGSSLAAAHVSGVAALLLAERPRLSWAELRDLLVASSSPVAAGGSQSHAVNACAALARLRGGDCAPAAVTSSALGGAGVAGALPHD